MGSKELEFVINELVATTYRCTRTPSYTCVTNATSESHNRNVTCNVQAKAEEGRL